MVDPGPVRLQKNTRQNVDPSEGSDPLPPDMLDINVEGRDLTPPDDGFGQLWRKRYRVELTGVDHSPEEVIQRWRQRFGEFWPGGSRFYRPIAGLDPGEAALFDLEMPVGARLSTGIVVARVEPDAFTFVTTRGHTFAGLITFFATTEGGVTTAGVQSVIRASDPLYEIGLPIGGHAQEDRFWLDTLRNLARHFGVDTTPVMTRERLDPHRRWRNAGNIRYNAFLHTAFGMITRPFRRGFGMLAARRSQVS